jgi:hypothetical protein
VQANRSKALTNIRAQGELKLSVGLLFTTWDTARLILDFLEHAEPTPFFLSIPILRQFRIISCKQQAALHSALYNNTPLVFGGTDKSMQLTIIKPTQTGINRNTSTFCTIKSVELLKNSKTSRVP